MAPTILPDSPRPPHRTPDAPTTVHGTQQEASSLCGMSISGKSSTPNSAVTRRRVNCTPHLLASTDAAGEKLRAPSPIPPAGPSSGALSAPGAARRLQAPGARRRLEGLGPGRRCGSSRPPPRRTAGQRCSRRPPSPAPPGRFLASTGAPRKPRAAPALTY